VWAQTLRQRWVLITAGLLASLTSPARSQTLTDRSPLDPVPGESTLEFQDDVPGLQVGAVRLQPSAGISMAYDSNLLAQPSPRIDRALTIGEAQLQAQDDLDEVALQGQAFVRARRFIGASEFNTSEFGGDLKADLPVGQQDDLTASVLAERRFESHTEIETPAFLPVSLYNDLRAELTYTHVFNRLSVRGDLSGQWLDYAAPTQHFRDFASYREELRLEYRLTDGAFLVAIPEHGRDDFHHYSPFVASANTTGGLLGIHWSVPEIVDFELTGGHFQRDYAGNLGKVSGLSLRGSLVWQPTRLLTVRGDVTRDDEPTRIPGAFGKARTDTSLQLEHAYSATVNLYARAELIRDDFNFIRRVDQSVLTEVGMIFLVGRPCLFKAAYGFGTRSSDAVGESYGRHVVTLSIIGRL
jgi:hypothetical protein